MYHFEMCRVLAVRLGYPPEMAAVESFAGVGYCSPSSSGPAAGSQAST